MTRESVDLDAVALPPLIDRAGPTGGKDYLPHDFERPEEVPPLSDFGGDHVTQYTTSSHDKAGYLTADPEIIQEMIDHYVAKIDAAREEIALYKHDREDGADTLIVTYGVTSRAARVAVNAARKRGRKVSMFTLQTLFPVPEAAIRTALEGVTKVIVPEMNMGQYILEVERLAGSEVRVVGINRMDTTLISPDEIAEKGGLL